MKTAILTLIGLILIFSGSYATERSIIDSAITEFFNSKLGGQTEGLSFTVNDYPENILSITDGAEIRIEGNIDTGLRKRIPFKVFVYDSTGRDKSAYITVIVSLEKKVVCSKCLIHMEDPLSEDNCEIRTVDVIGFPGDLINDMNQLTGRRAGKSFNHGSIINLKDTEPIPEILRGERVKIVAKGKNLTATADGIARQDGSIGDLIRVRNSKSNKTISALVTAEGIVEVSIIK